MPPESPSHSHHDPSLPAPTPRPPPPPPPPSLLFFPNAETLPHLPLSSLLFIPSLPPPPKSLSLSLQLPPSPPTPSAFIYPQPHRPNPTDQTRPRCRRLPRRLVVFLAASSSPLFIGRLSSPPPPSQPRVSTIPSPPSAPRPPTGFHRVVLGFFHVLRGIEDSREACGFF